MVQLKTSPVKPLVFEDWLKGVMANHIIKLIQVFKFKMVWFNGKRLNLMVIPPLLAV